jgi:hypothetical protein
MSQRRIMTTQENPKKKKTPKDKNKTKQKK